MVHMAEMAPDGQDGVGLMPGSVDRLCSSLVVGWQRACSRLPQVQCDVDESMLCEIEGWLQRRECGHWRF